MPPNPDMHRLLTRFSAFVTYSALRTEVPWGAHFDLPKGPMYRIEPRASLDPKAEALRSMEAVGTLPTALLIPGRRFDALGTRHGQGGGWYDRFLARVPSSWTRIGICFEEQFSKEPLTRHAWDQPMDYVFVVSNETTLLVDTQARSGRLAL